MAKKSEDYQVLEIVLTEIAAPLAARVPDISRVLVMTKAAVGRHMRRQGKSVATVARLLGMSERWVRTYTNNPIDINDRNLLKACLNVLMIAHPRSLAKDSVHQALTKRGYRMTLERCRKVLDANADMRHIERGGSGYRAKSYGGDASDLPSTEQVKKLSGSAKVFGRAALEIDCGSGAARFGNFECTVRRDQVVALDAAIRTAIAAILSGFGAEAHRLPAGKHSEWVSVHGEYSLMLNQSDAENVLLDDGESDEDQPGETSRIGALSDRLLEEDV